VAARYANAPSYSQMQAVESPAVKSDTGIVAAEPRTEEIAAGPIAVGSPVAEERLLKAEAPHQEESTQPSARDWETAMPLTFAASPSSLEDWENECSHNRWEPDLRLRPLELAPTPNLVRSNESEPRPAEEPISSFPVSSFAGSAERAKWDWPELARDLSSSEEIEPVEPDQPVHANLIEFPRELVATRKMRPRRAEGPLAASRAETQLSIFEVDPGAVSTRPESAAAAAAVWPEPAWAEIELEPQILDAAGTEDATSALQDLQLAPIGQRLVAALADSALIVAIVLAPALAAAGRIGQLHSTKMVEAGAILAFLIAGMLYYALLLLLAGATPGMNLARISLCTFDGQIPTREQLRSRLGALLLSLVPVGLGIAWALFDEDHLTWHDRLSRTYLREN
jgi:uncharacterized RDD family membrane protein YckC